MRASLLFLFMMAWVSAEVEKPKLEEEPPPLIQINETDKIVAAEGKKVTVRGQVLRTGKSKSGVNFLNFANYNFKAVTFKAMLKNFPEGEPADLYKGKTIEITGVIEKYKEQYEIKLKEPAQVRIVATEKAEPPKEKAQPPVEKTEPSPPSKDEKGAAQEAPSGPKPVDPKSFFKKEPKAARG